MVEFEKHGLDIARLESKSTSKKCTIAISGTPEIYLKQELELNKPFIIQIPNYGLKEIKPIRIDTFDIDVRVKDVPISPNICFIKSMDNSDFPENEKLLIIEQLDQLENTLKNHEEITQELKHDVSENITYVKTSLDRMGRKDGLILSMGLLGSFASGAFYAPDAATEMASTVSTVLPQFLDSVAYAFPAINNLARL